MIGIYDYTVILTYLSFLSGLTGIYFSLNGNTLIGIICIMISGLFDMFDGKVARTKKNRTETSKKFGIQIDSLSDLVAFGLLPSAIGIGLGLDKTILCFTLYLIPLCALIRLAYFNVLAEEKESKKIFNKSVEDKNYYYGLPVTSIAIILPFTYNLHIFLGPNIFNKAYPLIMLVTAILFVLNIKIKKPTGIWFVICSILAAIEIAIISASIR